jgi:LuxR family quorum-sensing system transcriptional regulator CciR
MNAFVPSLSCSAHALAVRYASPLTARQLECLSWISRGKSSTDIGEIMRISKRTVDHHVNVRCERLGVRTRVQAVACAVDNGWLIPAFERPAFPPHSASGSHLASTVSPGSSFAANARECAMERLIVEA